MGWTTRNLTADTAGAPLSVYQPTAWLSAGNSRHVVFQGYSSQSGGDGHLYELRSGPGGGWYVTDLTGEAGAPPVATNANGYVNARDGSHHVVYQGAGFDGHVHELWSARDGWRHNDLTAAADAPLTLTQPTGFATAFDGAQHVTFRGRDEHIHVLSHSGAGWHDEDVTALTGAPLTAADSTPTGYSFDDQRSAHLLARTDDGHVIEYWTDPAGWHAGDLTAATGAAAASDAATIHGYVFRGQGTQHVVFVGGDGHVHEFWWTTDGWRHTDVTREAGAPPAQATTSPACFAFEPGANHPAATQHVFFVGHDNFIHELWWNGDGWHFTTLTSAAAGSAPAVGDAVGFVEDDGSQNVYYWSNAHQIMELRWTPAA